MVGPPTRDPLPLIHPPSACSPLTSLSLSLYPCLDSFTFLLKAAHNLLDPTLGVWFSSVCFKFT